MSLLLYCIAKLSARLDESQPGVAGTAVSRVEAGKITAFVSRNVEPSVWLHAPLRTSAIEFHRVVMKIFDCGAIVPFRFPTIFAGDTALAGYLQEHTGKYDALLEKFAHVAQMEARVRFGQDTPTSNSGTEYLRQRQRRERTLADFASEVRTAADPVDDWRQRIARDGMRCFALVGRSQITQFRERLGAIRVPSGLSVRVSGPWPVAEFLDFENGDRIDEA